MPRYIPYIVLALALSLAACPNIPVFVSSTGDLGRLANPANPFKVELATSAPVPARIGTDLGLTLRSDVSSFLSLYSIGASGIPVAMFENLPLAAGQSLPVPTPGQPRVQFVEPAGTETFILVAATRPLEWLAPSDYATTGPLARINLSRQAFLDRLHDATARQPPATWQTATLAIQTVK